MKDELWIQMFSSEYTGRGFGYRSLGGLGVAVANLAQGLQRAGHKAGVVLPPYINGPQQGEFTDGQVPIRMINAVSSFDKGEIGERIFDFPPSYSDKDIAKYVENLEEWKRAVLKDLISRRNFLDVVHLHDWHFGTLAKEIHQARERGELNRDLTIVGSIHNGAYQGSVALSDRAAKALQVGDADTWGNLKLRLYNGVFSYLKTLIDYCDFVAVPGVTYAKYFNDRFPGLCNKELIPIPNGIDCLSLEGMRETETPETVTKRKGVKPRLLIASRLVPEKGLVGLLLALPKLSEDYEVNIIGNLPKSTFSFLDPSILHNKIIYHGFLSRSETLRHMHEASVFLHPSLDEPFGFAPVEAMIQGALPVVTNVGGHHDNFRDGENAIVMNGVTDEKVLVLDRSWPRKISDRELADEIVCGVIRATEAITKDHGALAAEMINNGRRDMLRGRWSLEKFVLDYEKLFYYFKKITSAFPSVKNKLPAPFLPNVGSTTLIS